MPASERSVAFVLGALAALSACALSIACVACATSPAGSVAPEGDGSAGLPGDAATGDGGALEDGRRDAPSSSGEKRVFTTSTQRAGDFGGVAGGDTVCQQAAGAANLGGTWRAWLSDGTTSASARIANVGPWALVDGTRVFPLNAVTSPIHDLDMDEYGHTGTKGLVWTGTAGGGSATTDTCSGWTSKGPSGTTGYAHVTTQWTDDGADGSPCSLSGRLYCFEQ